MSKYLEEYLVSLGFDLDSEEGKKYLALEEEIEKKNKELGSSDEAAAKSAKKRSVAQKNRIADTKEEINLANEKSKRGAGETVPQQQEKGPKGKTPPTRKSDTAQFDSLKTSIGQLGKAWDSFRSGNFVTALTQGTSGAKSFGSYIDSLSGAFGKTNKQAGTLKKTLADMFGSGQAKSAASGLSDVAEGAETAGASGLALTGVTAGIAAGVILVAKSAWDMADGLALANTNIETMARQLWISDSAAYQLNNTLSAMGKTTADLNEIAINPALNEQFKTLQEYQKTYAQLPSDFKEVNDAFVRDVETPTKEWQLQFDVWEKSVEENLQKNMILLFGGDKDLGLKNSGKDVTYQIGANGPELSLTPDFLSKVFPGLFNKGKESAPQNAQYTSSYAEGARIVVSPNITVNANSDSAKDIASATTDAVTESMNNSALVRNTRGPNR